MLRLLKGISAVASGSVERDRYLVEVNPLFLLARKTARGAAGMSFLMILADAMNWDFLAGMPVKRLEFVILWALTVAVIDVLNSKYGIAAQIAKGSSES